MNKLIIICPPNVPYNQLIEKTCKPFVVRLRAEIPMGAVSIATFIRQHFCDMEIHIIDFCIILNGMNTRFEFYNDSENVIKRELSKYKNENDNGKVYIGISSVVDATFTYLDVISKVSRDIWNDAFIFTGGTCSSNLAEEVFQTAKHVDAVDYGEGELPILKLLQANDIKDFLEINDSWITREKLNNGFVPKHDFIENLDDIDTLDYSFIEFEKYSSHAHNTKGEVILSAPVMFSRGCPFNCCFCASHSVHGKKVRYNSLNRIIHDINVMKSKYAINTLVIWDDNFFVDMDKAYALLDVCKELGLGIEFANSFPVFRMNEQLIIRLKEAGVSIASLAIESGCQRVLNEVMHKGHVKLDMVRQVIATLRKYDFYVQGLFVIGLPGETKAELAETAEFIKTAGLNWASVFAASPVAGSELYDICKNGNYFAVQNIEMHDFYNECIQTDEFAPKDIADMQLSLGIYVNYIHNWDMEHGNYDRALNNFENVMKMIDDNPFLYYCAANCAKELGLNNKRDIYLEKAQNIVNSTDRWDDMLKEYGLSFG